MSDKPIPTAQERLANAALTPSLDEFFARVPPLPEAELKAMLKKLRDERVTWGEGR